MARVPLASVSTTLTHTGAVLRRCRTNARGTKNALFYVRGQTARKFVAFHKTIAVIWTIVMERIFYHIIDGVPVQPHRPTTSLVAARLQPFYRAFKREAGFIATWTYEEFLGSVRGRKRRVYERAVQRLLAGWTWRDVAQWVRVKAFMKFEKLPVTGKRLVPRAIQPRSPEYNVLVGRYIKAAEHRLYKDIQEVFRDELPVVAKGLTTQELGAIIAGKWQRFDDPVCVGLDQSRFDQHISRAALVYEHKFYQAYFHSRELSRLLAYQHTTRGLFVCPDGIARYNTDGGRCSGDMNTGCGNTILQAAMIYCYLGDRSFRRQPSVMVNGDDSFIIVERRDAHKLEALGDYCRELGFELKVEQTVDVLEQISFCQMQPVFNGEQYVMMRSFPTCVNKDLYTTMRLTRDNYLSYFGSVGDCGLAIAAGVPVLQAFYGWMSAFTGNRMEIEGSMAYWSKGQNPHVLPVTDEARLSFYRATGVLPEHQIAIEEGYRTKPSPIWTDGELDDVFPGVDLGLSGGGHGM